MSAISFFTAAMTFPTVEEEDTCKLGAAPNECRTIRPGVGLSCARCVLAELGGLCVIVDNE